MWDGARERRLRRKSGRGEGGWRREKWEGVREGGGMEEGEVGGGEGGWRREKWEGVREGEGMEEGEVGGGEGRGNGNECGKRGAGVGKGWGMGLGWGGGHAARVLHNHTPQTLQAREGH